MLDLANIDIPDPEEYSEEFPTKQQENLAYVILQLLKERQGQQSDFRKIYTDADFFQEEFGGDLSGLFSFQQTINERIASMEGESSRISEPPYFNAEHPGIPSHWKFWSTILMPVIDFILEIGQRLISQGRFEEKYQQADLLNELIDERIGFFNQELVAEIRESRYTLNAMGEQLSYIFNVLSNLGEQEKVPTTISGAFLESFLAFLDEIPFQDGAFKTLIESYKELFEESDLGDEGVLRLIQIGKILLEFARQEDYSPQMESFWEDLEDWIDEKIHPTRSVKPPSEKSKAPESRKVRQLPVPFISSVPAVLSNVVGIVAPLAYSFAIISLIQTLLDIFETVEEDQVRRELKKIRETLEAGLLEDDEALIGKVRDVLQISFLDEDEESLLKRIKESIDDLSLKDVEIVIGALRVWLKGKALAL